MIVHPEPILARLPAAPNRFIIAGISVASLRKHLRPFPKKREEVRVTASIATTASNISVSVGGRSPVSVPALSTGSFTVELLFPHFKTVLTDAFDECALIVFDFLPGTMTVNGITTKSPQILVESLTATVDAIGSSANHATVEGVAALLRKAEALLQPLGITQTDLEHLLQQKVGHTKE